MSIDILKELKKPFDPKVISVRPGGGGMLLAYIDARDVMRRFDEVCGIHWQCRYPFEGCCEIGLAVADPTGKTEWIWRSNGAGETSIEGEKGQYSDAFKRAGATWGVGRYLYSLKNVRKEGNQVILPDWALPENYDKYKDFWERV